MRSSSMTTLGIWLLASALGGALCGTLGGCDSGRPPATPPPDANPPSGSGAPTSPPGTSPTSAGGAPTTAPTSTTAEPAPTASPSPELRWSGTWSSPSCGDRKYERRITLKEDKTFRAEERVSPCPPKVTCVWAGIVWWDGRWATEDKGVVLTKTSGGQGGPGGAVKIESPLRLEADPTTSSPVEVRGGERCVYTRFTEGSTPPGKTTAPGPSPAPAATQ